MTKVRVVTVDDSATMRAVLRSVLTADPEIEVVGEAADPYEAREIIKAKNPDVVTLDVEMPRMSGIQFLEKIMRLRPMPVIMISSLTQKGAADSIEALSMGAFDCVGKPSEGNIMEAFAELPAKVKAAASSRPRARTDQPVTAPVDEAYQPDDKIVAIGSSTGGVEALLQILSAFPAKCPPTVITQHMPESFIRSFADRLNKNCQPQIQTARDGALLEPGNVYIAPGGEYHLEVVGKRRTVCRLLASEPVSGHRPSVDVLFYSVAQQIKSRAVGVILTGMGRDGAKGLLAIKDAGGSTIGQNEDSSIVYGMPRVAMEIGAVQQQLALCEVAECILQHCRARPMERIV